MSPQVHIEVHVDAHGQPPDVVARAVAESLGVLERQTLVQRARSFLRRLFKRRANAMHPS